MRPTVVRGNVATPSPDSATAVESAPHEPRVRAVSRRYDSYA